MKYLAAGLIIILTFFSLEVKEVPLTKESILVIKKFTTKMEIYRLYDTVDKLTSDMDSTLREYARIATKLKKAK